ncbi:hypothetical protein CXB51_003170 [Gossypium anomalum]|uniref:Uncharacterized protein n=1 Tax=Gossypium anomalum TaxID=47600 RepID=A0A8J5Z6Y8_9ROSI|nr:hypothetical protein CXB51_003170 [Gossypium anomalum]
MVILIVLEFYANFGFVERCKELGGGSLFPLPNAGVVIDPTKLHPCPLTFVIGDSMPRQF